MKKLDLIIIKILLIILALGLTTSLILEFKLTLKLISVFLTMLYIGFLALHLMLCYPLMMIIQEIVDRTRDFKIKEKSIILFGLLRFLIFLIVFAAVYIATPIVLAMMCNGTIDLTEAFNRVENL